DGAGSHGGGHRGFERPVVPCDEVSESEADDAEEDGDGDTHAELAGAPLARGFYGCPRAIGAMPGHVLRPPPQDHRILLFPFLPPRVLLVLPLRRLARGPVRV